MIEPPTEIPRPLRADAARNRDRIIAAARAAFADRGVDVGVDEIAQRAGVGMGTLYRRFPTKESLILAIFEERVAELAQLAEDVAELEPFAALEAYMTQACIGMGDDRVLLQMLAEHVREHGTDSPGLIALRRRSLELLEPLVARARAAGAIRPGVDAADVAVLLRMLTAAPTEDGDPRRGRERYLGIVLAGLRP